jgi:transcriptional regulator with XRE-family HTH domain
MIVNNIKWLCFQRNTTVEAVAKAVGLSAATISRWHHSSPSVHNLKKVADQLGVTIDRLMVGVK